METVKKQADAITDLEAEVSKSRKQERAYEEAIEQLQTDLDALEQDNARLKTMAPNPERQGLSAASSICESLLMNLCSISRTARRCGTHCD